MVTCVYLCLPVLLTAGKFSLLASAAKMSRACYPTKKKTPLKWHFVDGIFIESVY